MAKIVVNSPAQGTNVYQDLAEREQRILKTQFVLINRRKLKRSGLIPRENEGGQLETNRWREGKKNRQRRDGIGVTKIPLEPNTHFQNHQMIVREAKPLLLIETDM
jgi:hypothetical protein